MIRECRLNVAGLTPDDAAREVMAECVSQGAAPEAVAQMMKLTPDEGAALWASISDGADQWEASQHD